MKKAVLTLALLLGCWLPSLAEIEFRELEQDGSQVFLVTGVDSESVLRTGRLVVWRGPRKADGLYSVVYLQTAGKEPLNSVVRRGAYPNGTEWYTIRFMSGNLYGEQSADGRIRSASKSRLKGRPFNWV